MSLIQKLISIGAYSELDEEVRSKIVLANKINLFLITGCLFLVLIIYPHKEILALTIIAACSYMLFMLFSYLKLNGLSRFMTAVAGIFVNSYTHAVMLPPDHSPSPSLIAMSMAQIPLAFVLFHYKERKKIIAAILVDILLIGSYKFTGRWLYHGYEYVQNDNPTNHYYIVMMSACIAVGALYLQLVSIIKATQTSQKALASLEEHKIEMEHTQQQLQKTLEEVQEARKEDDKRNWVSTGLAKFTEMLRTHNELEQTYDDLISGLVRYVSANQAALFVLNKEEGERSYLSMAACYAYDRKKHIEKHIEIGQGMIGQTFLEGETLKLTEIPQGYIQITSGLGEAPPDHLLIVPLKVNDEVEGILEVASFQSLEPYQVAFLEKLGESLASAIANNRITATTRSLLEKFKLQSEELQNHEEEMRQNMEELQATQEEMQRKEREYIERIQQLEQQ